MSALWFRGLAIGIALAAAIDPAIVSTRRTRPLVAVVAVDSVADGALADRIARELANGATVVRAPFQAANATVIAGDRLPDAAELASAVFAVQPEPAGPVLRFERVDAPVRSSLEARVSMSAAARLRNARGRTAELVLRAGPLVVDRLTHRIETNAEDWAASLTYVPTLAGTHILRLELGLENAEPQSSADIALEVEDRPWAILFYDPRPSWMSTFVRRALERDPRFAVTSRIVTSRDAGIDTGRPPALDGYAPLVPFDAIVVGAPHSLSEREVQGLEAYLRRRGGALVLLQDEPGSGPYRRLLGVSAWADANRDSATTLASATTDTARLRAAELLWPARLPPAATALAVTADSAQHPVVWQAQVGAGPLVVSGALDAWRYRDAGFSDFDAYWRSLIARLAAASPPPLDLTLSHTTVEPGEPVEALVTLRDIAFANLDAGQQVVATVTARLAGPDGPVSIRLWPDGLRGQLRGAFRAPAQPGTYAVAVSSGSDRSTSTFVVQPRVSRVRTSDAELLAATARATGGSAVAESQLDELPALIDRTLRPEPRRVTWHPMRSAWWILPFALALGAEWLARRRKGLA